MYPSKCIEPRRAFSHHDVDLPWDPSEGEEELCAGLVHAVVVGLELRGVNGEVDDLQAVAGADDAVSER